MVSQASKRRAAQYAVERGLGRITQACRAVKLARSGYYRLKKISRSSQKINNQIVRLSRKHPWYGYRRITALLRREGRCVNAKRVARVSRAEGLQVCKRQRRMRRLGPSQTQRLGATRCNQVWSWDFVADQTESGSAFRILTLMDEHTRQWLATHVAWSIRAPDVLAELEQAMRKHGTPEHIGSDNGPEFIAHAIQDWLAARQIKTLYIRPDSPWENAHIESFHDKLRDECLNREVFDSATEQLNIINPRRPKLQLSVSLPGEGQFLLVFLVD